MALIKQKHTPFLIIIAGAGNLGTAIINGVSLRVGEDIAIDRNEAALLSSGIYQSVVGDATDISTLRDAGADHARSLIAATGSDSTNMMIAQMAKEIFNIKSTICCLQNPAHDDICRSLGISSICPAIIAARRVSDMLCTAYERECSDI